MNTNALSRDELLLKWEQAKASLASAKENEATIRKAVFEVCFPNPNEGVNTLELGNGYQLKGGYKLNYTLDDNPAVEAALDRIEATGNEGKFLAERLVSWKPTLSLAEYRTLAPHYKALIDEVLTIKPGLPTLEIKEPKA